jgi:hypothetical protein
MTPLTPRAADGKPFYLPNIFPGEVILNFTGCSDTADHRFHGDLFGVQVVGIGEATQTADFLDGFYLAGGHLYWDGGSWGNYIYMELQAPATTTKAPAIQGQGNCNKVATGYGFNIIVPAAGNGEFDIDVPVPVPANDQETNEINGYWQYSDPWVGKGTVSAGVPGASKYNLYDAGLEIAHFAKIHTFLASGMLQLMAPAIKPKWILPQWKIVVKAVNTDANKTFRAGYDLMLARRRTT